jgi:eukaryotic-like serine/threonine-protein kinase
VICVRLAPFAQMMKDRPWTPASLRGVGGALGVGVTFLEETFSAAGAPPECRYHQKAARAILKALPPDSGIDIMGHMRSESELLALSGDAGQPRNFAAVVHILDSELRLITLTDLEGVSGQTSGSLGVADPVAGQLPSSTRYYQLTHDYLVPSLRDWLTRKQRETRRGRAELRLAERSAIWFGRPENRFLPSLWEWLTLSVLTRRQGWTATQRTMMRRAARHYAAWGGLLFAGTVLLLLAGREGYGRQRAQLLQDSLLEAATEDVPNIVSEMGPYRRWLDGLLRMAYSNALAGHDTRRAPHASLGLLPVDGGQVGYLGDRLLKALPQEVLVISEALQPHAAEASPRLWEVLEDKKRPAGGRLRAASALAAYAGNDARWQGVRPDVAARLVAEPGLVIARWAEAFRPVRPTVLSPLAEILVRGRA